MRKTPEKILTDDTVYQTQLTRQNISTVSTDADVTESLETEDIAIMPFISTFVSQENTYESDYGECPFADSSSIEQNGGCSGLVGCPHNVEATVLDPKSLSRLLQNERDQDEANWVDEINEEEEFDKVPSSFEAALVKAEHHATNNLAYSITSSRQTNNAHKRRQTKTAPPRGSGFEGTERFVRPEHRRKKESNASYRHFLKKKRPLDKSKRSRSRDDSVGQSHGWEEGPTST
ncbi:hypothetical protein C7974DRAFT_418170 [Boeremia exigua]|uniref:uncharacterized protein n=1 Tax=Boeremia exigua TaxID=749465 RepID=UPI001E8CC905|nr:uncharacterized protein C7974DRAFT_418170 [Boeremia exigua]KAH6613078.1 hypothetical protein C7974DRAFT_418170 [Boeremia exigua]